jgi:hypothetical protein
MHQPGIEPGSVPWQGTILPLDHWCFGAASNRSYISVLCTLCCTKAVPNGILQTVLYPIYIEKISFSIAPAAFSKWSSKIENATGFLYIERFSLLFSIFSLRFKH